ncbi:MAG: hypothetical protein ABFD75_11305 [Smithella sp.]
MKIPIKALKIMAQNLKLTHIVVFAYDGEKQHVATYGKTIEGCSQAADFGNRIKDQLGWPEILHAQPSRVRALVARIKELEQKLQENSGDDQRVTTSNRGKEWLDFSPAVLAHVDNYTIPQWGDKPNDQLHTEWSIDDCMLAIKKYANRAGKNSRGPAEDLRDLLKIAHYACVAWSKRQGL